MLRQSEKSAVSLRSVGLAFVATLLVSVAWGGFALKAGMTARPEAGAPGQDANVPIPKVEFVDLAAKAGLNFLNVTGPDRSKEYILESTGGGVALFDYDRDGFPDVFLVNGSTLQGFPKGEEPINRLFRNNRDGSFRDVTMEANLIHSGWGQGVCSGDFDNDGYDDLLVTYYGQNVLYRNKGDGTFEDVTEKAGLKQTRLRYNTGCSFLDYDRDGKLDLFVANYVNLEIDKTVPKSSLKCIWKGVPVYCGPQGLPGGTNLLYHNNGDGTFTDVSDKSGITKTTGQYAFTTLVCDFDNDGWPDIYVACDSAPNILYRNQHNGTFSDVALFTGTAFNSEGKTQGGMGLAAGDYDEDGNFDILKTNFDGDIPTLYHNNGDGTFLDVTLSAGLGIHTNYLGWGTGFIDIDNDGWKDIFMANGHVYPEVDQANLGRSYQQRRLVYFNLRDGSFKDISAQAGPAVADRRSSRGIAVGDVDNDGSLEIVINNISDRPSLLKNHGEKKNWVIVKAVGTRSNRDGIGARVIVTTGQQRQMDEVRSGGSFISQSDLRLHFGLGDAAAIDRIDVQWPSGLKEYFQNLKANQIVTLEEGRGVKF